MTERQERFAQLLHAGVPLLDAYQQAGYRRDLGNAVRAAARVRGRVRELAGLPPMDDDLPDSATMPPHWRKGAMALRLDDAERIGQQGISREAVVGLQWQILQAAVRAGNTAAANTAVKQLAQLLGFWIERSEAKQIVETAEADPAKLARAMLEILDRQTVDVTPPA